ncbi:hypothetical protein [Natrinema gari]|uniref:hypothetical protein n=1 Tax=Natrinema gari TaxID=419186 RepID=UPI0009FBF400|nr:hypothetical protein [Natrinema gari]
MSPNKHEPDPSDALGFDRVIGLDDQVLGVEYGNQGYRPKQEATDGDHPPIDDLHEVLLETRDNLQQLEEQLPDPLTLTDSINELNETAAAYSHLESDNQ